MHSFISTNLIIVTSKLIHNFIRNLLLKLKTQYVSQSRETGSDKACARTCGGNHEEKGVFQPRRFEASPCPFGRPRCG